MANHLDFLHALDEYIHRSSVVEVTSGFEMHEIAWTAGLVQRPEQTAAWWTGQLVELGYLEYLGSPMYARAPPRGLGWTDRELQEFSRYRVTAAGHQHADALRRRRREEAVDATLGRGYPLLAFSWMDGEQRAAVARPLSDLRRALEDGQPIAAIGHARELAEAACKVLLARAGEPIPTTSLPTLFKAAAGTVPETDVALGRSLTAAMQRLGDLRNAVGAGHGQAFVSDVSSVEARFVASAACAVAEYLLARVGESSASYQDHDSTVQG